jgi:dolichol-phosphate mannosyltransferase
MGVALTRNIALGVVCPMANERQTAVQFATEVLDVCSSYGFKSIRFFAVLDNVSTDGTRNLLSAYAAQDPRLEVIWAPENRCIVDAYVRGYRAALNGGSDWILEIDAGYSHRPSEIPRLFEKMREGYDCVFGSRFCEGGDMSQNSLKRRLLSRGGTLLSNALLRTKLWDMTSGFQLFSRSAIQGILDRGIQSRGPFFQTEMKAYCQKLRIAEVPITYSGANHSIGGAAIGDSFKGLWRLFQLRLQNQL